MKAADLARVMEVVAQERDRLYTEIMDATDESLGEFTRLRVKMLSREWEDRRAEYKSLRASYYRAVEAEKAEGGAPNGDAA